MNKSRFEAFSDSVFAFAITLLVLGIVLPAFNHAPVSDSDLRDALFHLFPNVLAYALSFAVIGLMWQNHQALFRLVERIDRKTVLLNLLLLGFTAFIPFVTSTVGSYWWLHSAAFLYGLVLTCCSTAYNGLLEHLIRSHAFHSHVDAARVARTRTAFRVGFLTYVFAMLVALVSPVASLALYIVLVAYYLIPRGVDSDL